MTALVNNMKTMVLLAALFALLVFVGSFWGREGMIVAGAFALVMNFVAWFFSDKIAIASMRGREVDEQSAPQLLDLVRRLADRAGLPMPRVYVCPHDAPNAFATGRSPRRAAVAVTQGALQLLDHDELAGVMAHELAHVKNRDTLISTIAATVAGLFSFLLQMSMHRALIGGRQEGNPLAILAIPLAMVGAILIKAMISRSREFVADADGAKIAGTPHGLVSALQKLEMYAKRIPLGNPNPAMNNLFIIEPLVGMRSLANLFASHPPTAARVEALLRG
jgi:heat shock protein HtpX